MLDTRVKVSGSGSRDALYITFTAYENFLLAYHDMVNDKWTGLIKCFSTLLDHSKCFIQLASFTHSQKTFHLNVF